MVQELEKRPYEKADTFHLVIWLASLAVIAVTSIYGVAEAMREYLLTGEITVGQTLVEIDFPFPYFAKPITYLSVAIVTFTYSTFKRYEKKVSSLSGIWRSSLLVFTLVLGFVSAYEVLYNFSVWNALITADAIAGQIRIDLLNVPYPNPNTPWNLVFATKIFFATSTASLYSFYSLQRNARALEKEV